MPEAQPAEVRDPTRLNRGRWTVVAGGWCLLLIIPLVGVLTSERPLPFRVLLAAGLLTYAACYIVGVYQVLVRPTTGRVAGLIAVMTALWLATALADTGSFTVSYLLVAVLVLMSPRAGRIGAVLLAACALVVVTAVNGFAGPTFLGDLITMSTICLAQIGMVGLIHVNSQLRAEVAPTRARKLIS
jgi:hypothetical protein